MSVPAMDDYYDDNSDWIPDKDDMYTPDSKWDLYVAWCKRNDVRAKFKDYFQWRQENGFNND